MSTVPQRIVSLIPSETYNLARLGALDRLVGRTRYCVDPPEVQNVAPVGGTKDVSVQQVVDLSPDLVLANQEENSKQDVEALIDAGLDVRVVFPKTVDEGFADLVSLAELLEVDGPLVQAARQVRPPFAAKSAPRCFVPIWRDPWVTINDETYIGDVLRWLGLSNVFGDHPSTDDEDRDTRYARVTWEQIEEAAPQVVLLPDEPYAFGPEHVSLFEALGLNPSRIHCVNGRDLCWHGVWALEGLPRLAAMLER